MTNIEYYNSHYSEVLTDNKRELIEIFKEAKTYPRPFKKFYIPFLKKIKEDSDNKYVFKNQELYPKAHKVFEFRHDFHLDEEKEVISKILDNEIKEYFEANDLKAFRPFIIDMAKQKALQYLHNHLENYYNYYELIYLTDKYEYFYLKNFELINYKDSKEFNEMLDIEYPDRINRREDENRKDHEISESIKQSTSRNNTELFDSFTDDERLVVANVFFDIKDNKAEGLSLPAFFKLNKIVGACNDESIYLIKGKYTTPYYKARKGVSYYPSYKTQIDLLKSTILKLNKLELKVVSSKLKMIKYQLERENR
ncbi:hypothetical protein [Winogradskyella thalassocola]|uniref:Uncharacterized protein n=1 Tax=Winogradskyella thalassocola TaxID=262004 RepID=A0A1G7ZLE2_9FLAO|nr:hypothetical protein [Winogradskyella thalassocola]SDH09523.1 hypothetical protein SAMN04489796_1011371 [Winogradskyella thalassocola]